MKVKAKFGEETIEEGLMPGKIYHVFEIDDEYYRVVTSRRSGPCLYAKYLFDVVDAHIPEEWVMRAYEDEEYYISPPEFSEKCFWEDWHDGIESAKMKFAEYIKRYGISID